MKHWFNFFWKSFFGNEMKQKEKSHKLEIILSLKNSSKIIVCKYNVRKNQEKNKFNWTTGLIDNRKIVTKKYNQN